MGAGDKCGAVVCFGGPCHAIDVDGRRFHFEMHSYFGPMPLRRNLEPARTVPGRTFWEAVALWDRQGRRVSGQAGDAALCVWDREKPRRAGDLRCPECGLLWENLKRHREDGHGHKER